MEIKMDKRLIKTEEKLYNAFLKLFTIKPYEDISINDICNVANIKRPTFYNHFENKEDFVRKTTFTHFKKIIEESKISPKASFKIYFLTLIEGYLKDLSKYKDNIRILDKSNDAKKLTIIFYESLFKLFKEKIESLYPNELNDSLIETFVDAHVGIFIAIISRYLLSDNKDINTLIKDLSKVFNASSIEKQFKK